MVQLTSESKVPNRDGNQNFSMRNIVTILYRRRWIILAVALPLIIVGGTSLFGQAGTYTASARVVVDLARVDLPKWRPGLQGVDYNRDLNTLINSAMTLPVAQRAADAIRDSIPVMQSLDEELFWLSDSGALEEYLLNGLDVSVMGESAVLNFQFTSTRPRISLMAVDALRKAFLEFQVYGQKNEKAVEYYEERADYVRATMDSLLVVREVVLNEAGYTNLDDDLKHDSGALAGAEEKLRKVEIEVRAQELEVTELRSYLDEDPRNFPMGPDENRSSTLVYWMNLIAQHEDKLNQILTDHTETSVAATRQKEVIEQALKKLANEERKYVQSSELHLATLKEREAALREQLEFVRARTTRAPAVYRKVSLIDSELKSYRQLLTDLQGKIGEVSLATYADERISNTQVLDVPSIVSVFTGSTTIIYFVALILMSLALGIVVGFVVENLDHRIYSPVDVEDNLKLPVFASVTRVE